MTGLPVYDISGLSDPGHPDVLVCRFGPYLQVHHKLRIPHGHSFYHAVYFTKGNGSHTIDFDQFEVRPFQIYFMIPGQVHNWEFSGEVDGFVINFSPSFFQSFLLSPDYLENFSFLRGAAKDSVLDVPAGLQPKLQSLFEDMLQVEPVAAVRLDKLRVLILQLLLTVAETDTEQREKSAAPYNFTLLRNFQKLISKNYAALRLPKQYAELLYVTPNHLNALCSQMMGISAGELIRNRILLEAKRLLINAELPVAHIAYRLSFNDSSYFSKFFKKQTGLTPEAFRKQALKQH